MQDKKKPGRPSEGLSVQITFRIDYDLAKRIGKRAYFNGDSAARFVRVCALRVLARETAKEWTNGVLTKTAGEPWPDAPAGRRRWGHNEGTPISPKTRVNVYATLEEVAQIRAWSYWAEASASELVEQEALGLMPHWRAGLKMEDLLALPDPLPPAPAWVEGIDELALS